MPTSPQVPKDKLNAPLALVWDIFTYQKCHEWQWVHYERSVDQAQTVLVDGDPGVPVEANIPDIDFRWVTAVEFVSPIQVPWHLAYVISPVYAQYCNVILQPGVVATLVGHNSGRFFAISDAIHQILPLTLVKRTTKFDAIVHRILIV